MPSSLLISKRFMAADGTAILSRMPDLIADLIDYIDRSPTPYHAVAETRERLVAEGYAPLSEDEVWELAVAASSCATMAVS